MKVPGQPPRALRTLKRCLQPSLFALGLIGAASTAGVAAEKGVLGPTAPAGADEYIGVSPGSGNKNPLPKPESSAPQLVWTGFQPSETGGRVFLQTTMPVTYGVKEGGKQLVLTLHNCRVHLKNNERDLNTSFFDTPVAGIKTRQLRREVEVVISLKTAVSATPRVEDGPDGLDTTQIGMRPHHAAQCVKHQRQW